MLTINIKMNCLSLVSAYVLLQLLSGFCVNSLLETTKNISDFQVFKTFLNAFSSCTIHVIQSDSQQANPSHELVYGENENLIFVQSTRVYPNISYGWQYFWLSYKFDQGNFQLYHKTIIFTRHQLVCVVDLLLTVLVDTETISTKDLELMLVQKQNSGSQDIDQLYSPDFIVIPFSAESQQILYLPVPLFTRSVIILMDVDSYDLSIPSYFCSDKINTFRIRRDSRRLTFKLQMYKFDEKLDDTKLLDKAKLFAAKTFLSCCKYWPTKSSESAESSDLSPDWVKLSGNILKTKLNCTTPVCRKVISMFRYIVSHKSR